MNKNEINTSQQLKSPFAKYQGYIKIGGNEIDCYVLDTGDRVITLRAIVKSIAKEDHSNLKSYIDATGLRDYLPNDFLRDKIIEFYLPGSIQDSKGITAEVFLEICSAYVEALADNRLTTDRQREIALKCSLLLAACSKVGLIALIDEATGYQYEREGDALQIKLRAFLSDELRAWEKTFPDELWKEFARLTGWDKPLHKRPKWWGKLVMELIYNALDPDVAEYLKNNKPAPIHGQNYHQWLSSNYGLKQLITHINQIIGISKTCSSINELRTKVAEIFSQEPVQLTMYLPKSKP